MSSYKKYLSIFIDRFVPSYLGEDYPLYKSFIEKFLEYMEQDDKIYDEISNLIDFQDIDKIAELKNSLDSEKSELGDKIIYEIFEQFLGSKESRYLSTLLDEILYLKIQKGIFQRKGTKYSFLFFFLLVLSGFFRITNIDKETKKHNGYWKYNGYITYNSEEYGIDPFIYLIISEFYPSQYENILNILNPAGILPLKFFLKLAKINDIVNDISDYENLYVVLYDENLNRLGMIKPYRYGTYEQITGTQTYDIELLDYTTWRESSVTGVSHYYLEIIFNTSYFGDVNFSAFKIVKNNTLTDIYYTDSEITSEGTELIGLSSFEDGANTGEYENYPIIDNTGLQFLISF